MHTAEKVCNIFLQSNGVDLCEFLAGGRFSYMEAVQMALLNTALQGPYESYIWVLYKAQK